jgi:thioredoxin 1
MQFLAANMRLVAPLNSSLAVQIAERILSAKPAPAYRYAAGAYLAVFDRTKFNRLDNLFDGCREALQKMDRAGLAGVGVPEFPRITEKPAAATATPGLLALAEKLRASSQELLPVQRGQVTLVHFWARWCAPCRREQPILDRLASTLKDRGLSVASVDADRDQRAQKEFEVSTLPVALLFNRDGDLVERFTGEQSEADFLGVIAPLLVQ